MIEVITGMPDNVLGLRATGKVTGEDYEKVLIPAVEERLRRHQKIRLLYHMGPDFVGFTPAAMWDDARVGVQHIASFEKIAVVTDLDWVIKAVKIFSFAIPSLVRTFGNGGLEEAISWVTSPSPSPIQIPDFVVHTSSHLLRHAFTVLY